jgi:hypothetical protein
VEVEAPCLVLETDRGGGGLSLLMYNVSW